MHVLMVTDSYWPFLGGVEQHVRTVSQELIGLVEIVEDGVSGLPVAPSSVAERAKALRLVDIDDSLCASLSAGGTAAVQRNTAERVVDEIIAVYEDAIAEQQSM